MSELTLKYVTLIIAIYGVIQIWIIALWKNYINKGIIKIYETGFIEIGFGLAGATIVLNGTLRAINKNIFISSIELLLIRERDKSQRNLKWLAFLSPKFELKNQQVLMELPSGFLLSPESPYRFNILFYDTEMHEEVSQLLFNYNKEWFEVENKLRKKIDIKEPIDSLIEDFRKNKTMTETFSSLHRKFYWEPGEYSLTIKVNTSKPDLLFSNIYKFVLNDSDFERLKLNIVTMLEDPIARFTNKPNYYYNTVNSKYL